MSHTNLKIEEKIATITINRPKVNALNEGVVEEISGDFDNVRNDKNVNAVILTGEGSFFSFGFDVPGFMDYPKDSFERYVLKYSELVKNIFMFPKPVIGALNGHTVAGGCVLAIACDQRVMISGKAKIALNEMTFGSTLFSCVTETLKYAVGPKSSEKIIYSGKMFSADEALELGMVDKIANENEFNSVVQETARNYDSKDLCAFASVKKMLKTETLENIEKHEAETISEFVDIWYSESTRYNLKKIEIRS